MHHPNGVEFATTRLATGVRLHYAERGDREGEAIIFLHAYADSWYWFSRVLPLLSPEFRALVPDQRGHGDSDKPECCYTKGIQEGPGLMSAPALPVTQTERRLSTYGGKGCRAVVAAIERIARKIRDAIGHVFRRGWFHR